MVAALSSSLPFPMLMLGNQTNLNREWESKRCFPETKKQAPQQITKNEKENLG